MFCPNDKKLSMKRRPFPLIRLHADDGGAGVFIIVLLLFLGVVGGGIWFFTQHPEGKKLAADFLKQYINDGTEKTNGDKPVVDRKSVV